MENIAKDIVKAIIEEPIGMEIGEKYLQIYPITLGKSLILGKLLTKIGINEEIFKKMPYIELMRVASDKREECCKFLAYHTMKRKEEILNFRKVQARTDYLSENMDVEDIVGAMMITLSNDNYNSIIKKSGIEKELLRLSKAQKAKEDKNTFIFGGRTIYGSLIGNICEKYHWTFDYVVWGISYINLRMLLADGITTVYLSDKERKKVHIPNRASENIRVDDPKNYEKVLAMKFD